MPIDPNFDAVRDVVDQHEGHDVWGPVDDPGGLGIHGTRVAVDLDLCIGDGACVDACPADVFDWLETPDHPEGDRKADPVNESQCIDCQLCVQQCPTDAIAVNAGQ